MNNQTLPVLESGGGCIELHCLFGAKVPDLGDWRWGLSLTEASP